MAAEEVEDGGRQRMLVAVYSAEEGLAEPQAWHWASQGKAAAFPPWAGPSGSLVWPLFASELGKQGPSPSNEG